MVICCGPGARVADGQVESSYTLRSSSSGMNPVIYSDANPFLILKLRAKIAALIAGWIGFFNVFALFIAGLAFFPWYLFDAGIDILIVVGFVAFLVFGVAAHIFALSAVYTRKTVHFKPYLVFHSFITFLTVVVMLFAITDLVAIAEKPLDPEDDIARLAVLICPVVLTFEILMLHIILKFKTNIFFDIKFIQSEPPAIVTVMDVVDANVNVNVNVNSPAEIVVSPALDPSDSLKQVSD